MNSKILQRLKIHLITEFSRCMSAILRISFSVWKLNNSRKIKNKDLKPTWTSSCCRENNCFCGLNREADRHEFICGVKTFLFVHRLSAFYSLLMEWSLGLSPRDIRMCSALLPRLFSEKSTLKRPKDKQKIMLFYPVMDWNDRRHKLFV